MSQDTEKETPNLDALLALRKCLSEDLSIEERGDELVLNGTAYAKDQVTPFQADDGAFFTLEVLHLFMVHTKDGKTDISEYFKDSHARNVANVKFKDRKEVSNFLTGKSAWSDKITGDSNRTENAPVSRPAKEVSDAHKSDETKESKQPESSPEELLIKRLKNRESSHYDRNSILLSSHRFAEALRLERDTKKQKTIMVQKEMLKAAQEDVPTRGLMKGPIIIVPAGINSTINMYNIKKFLEDGVYEHPTIAKDRNPEKPDILYVERAIADCGIVRFKVVDSVKKFNTEDWDRVVAVFAVGPSWQFKDWKQWKSDPAIIFANSCGLHVYFDDAKLQPHIKTWNVLLCPLKKQTRSQDGIEHHRIWGAIQKFLSTKKPDILKAGVIRRYA